MIWHQRIISLEVSIIHTLLFSVDKEPLMDSFAIVLHCKLEGVHDLNLPSVLGSKQCSKDYDRDASVEFNHAYGPRQTEWRVGLGLQLETCEMLGDV